MSFQDKIAQANQLKEVTVPVHGVEFTLREMTGDMRDAWDSDNAKRVKFKGQHPDLNTLDVRGVRALVVAMTLVDDSTGERAFDYTDADALAEIGSWSGNMLEELADAAQKLCGLVGEDIDDEMGN